MHWRFHLVLILLLGSMLSRTQSILLIPDRVFDGESFLDGWQVLVQGTLIKEIKPVISVDKGTTILKLPGTTLMPGMIEGHSHILLHPYDETSWNDQVLTESRSERVLRAALHLKASLMAGFTTLRDLGTEGVDYADVEIKQALAKGILIGPDLICAGRAIVATGSYGPKSMVFSSPRGAEEADGQDLIRVVRDQIGHGVDVIKIYADYRWGPFGAAMPTFSIEEIKSIVETAASSGRRVVAHASTKEGMRRAILGGVSTIEHGDEGDAEIFALMKKFKVSLCPTLAAGEAIMSYKGWEKNTDSLPDRIKAKMMSFKLALQSGVKIIFGGDVGVFAHGENARELLLMKEYGMTNIEVLKTATSINSDVFGLDHKGSIKPGYLADIVIVMGHPGEDLKAVQSIKLVMKSGKIL